jgi:DNA gyrase subunit A
MKVADISEQGRATQGVKLIRLDEGDEIAAITKIEDQEVVQNGENGNGNTNENGINDNPENATTE